MPHAGAAMPRRLGRGEARRRRRPLTLIALAPPAADAPVVDRWPRVVGLALAIGLSASLWALLIFGVCLLLS